MALHPNSDARRKEMKSYNPLNCKVHFVAFVLTASEFALFAESKPVILLSKFFFWRDAQHHIGTV